MNDTVKRSESAGGNVWQKQHQVKVCVPRIPEAHDECG